METIDYLTDLRTSVLEQNNIWQGVAQKFGANYAAAYDKQQKDLAAIRRALEDDQKRTQAIMSLTLSLLTGGILGPLANKLGGKIFSYERATDLANAKKFITKDEVLTEWCKNAFTELVKAGDDKVRGLAIDAATGAAPDEGFSPATLTPAEYSDRIKLGMSQRAVAMSDIAKLMYDTLQWLPASVAQSATTAMKTSDYFSQTARDLFALDDKVVQRSASIMLWIAWGKVRDTAFWNEQVAKMTGGQSLEWAPLLKILQGLGIPTKTLTMTVYTPVGTFETGVSTLSDTTINMPKFIEWAKGSTAASLAFAGLPTNENGRKNAELQMTIANTIYGR